MTEKLLQYIWQFQFFNNTHLQSVTGENIQVIHPGQFNQNQGPDFSDARIRIGSTVFAGSVELHIRTSEWKQHGHQDDPNYKNVILHVVLYHDDLKASLPVLELQSRISHILLERYNNLMNSPFFIPCSSSLEHMNQLVWSSWKERLLAERLTRKSNTVRQYLEKNKVHWSESFWWMLARNFGTQVNAEAFEAMAISIPLTLLSRHKHQIHHIEALLFGQAGLLNQRFKDDYPRMLQREYIFFKKKYGLTAIRIPVHFLRMRPGNFPSVRLAQLSSLIHQSVHLFSNLVQVDTIADVKKMFDVTANDYWHYHYRFDEASAFKKKKLGEDMINTILINTVIPFVFTYGIYHHNTGYQEKAVRWLQETEPEMNSITLGFMKLIIANKTAYDSQALIELKNEYCTHKRCLDCSVGNALLRNS